MVLEKSSRVVVDPSNLCGLGGQIQTLPCLYGRRLFCERAFDALLNSIAGRYVAFGRPPVPSIGRI